MEAVNAGNAPGPSGILRELTDKRFIRITVRYSYFSQFLSLVQLKNVPVVSFSKNQEFYALKILIFF